MNARDAVLLGLMFLLYLSAQILLVRNVVLFEYAFCFLYIGWLLYLPYEIDTWIVLFVAFLVGLVVGVFYNAAGIHAAACVLLAFLRKPLIKAIFPAKTSENNVQFSSKEMTMFGFLQYTLCMIFIHHATLFLIEAGSPKHLILSILKIIFSTLFTTFAVLIIQRVFRE